MIRSQYQSILVLAYKESNLPDLVLMAFQTLPTKLTAGSELPEFLVVVRPKKGSGASYKQQMICSKLFEMKLQVTFKEGFSSRRHNSLPAETMWKGSVRGCERNNVKQCYVFNTSDLKFVKQGTYHLRFELVRFLYLNEKFSLSIIFTI